MIKPGRIYAGTTVTSSVAFQTDNGVAQAVTTVVFKTIDPDGNEDTYTYGTDTEVALVDVGIYTASIKPLVPGRWHTRWEADDEIAVEDMFLVQRSPFSEEGRKAYQ